MSLDIEGVEYEVLKTIPFDKVKLIFTIIYYLAKMMLWNEIKEIFTLTLVCKFYFIFVVLGKYMDYVNRDTHLSREQVNPLFQWTMWSLFNFVFQYN